MIRLACTVALFMVGAAAHAEPLDPPTLAARYLALQSYCDEVLLDHGRGGRPGSRYQRCFVNDGRFKTHEFVKDMADSEHLRWGDSERLYIWNSYWRPWRGRVTHSYSENRRERTRGWFDDALAPLWINGFAGFDSDPACEPGLRCYARSMKDPNGTAVGSDRLWLRAGDGLIARFERRWNNGMSFSAAVSAIRVDTPANQLDLEHTAPLLARYSYSARPRTFLTGVVFVCFGAGFALWFWLDLRRLRAGRALPERRVWRIYAWIVLACAVPLGLLTLATRGISGGHPPPIYFALVADAIAGYALVCLGALLAGVHLARKQALRKFSSAPSAPPA